MYLLLITYLCLIQLYVDEYECLKFLDLPSDDDEFELKTLSNATGEFSSESTTDVSTTLILTNYRRLMEEQYLRLVKKHDKLVDITEEGQDVFIKRKISAIIDQSIEDTTKKVKSIQDIKEKTSDRAPYRVGFLLSMVTKCRLMIRDLYNLAMKHRNNWKALQQMRVFEYIVHTNVDTTNLVRQLVETHIQYLNSTDSGKRKVVLL